jgi:predicted DNA-binding protein
VDKSTIIAKLRAHESELKAAGIEHRIARRPFFPYLEGMEVHFTAETEKKLKDLSAQTGRGIDDFVEDATAAYVEELLRTRDMLSSRYDDLKSGRVKPIDGEEAFARLKAKTEAQRNRPE